MSEKTTTTEETLTYEQVMVPLRAAWSDEVRQDIEQLRAELAVQSKVRRARLELRLTQTQAHDLTGFDQGDISKMERGEITPSPKRLLRYLDALQNAAERGLAAVVTADPLTTARDAALYLLEIQSHTAKITQLKLHKLLYYGQGYSLGLLNQPLFADKIFAWDLGPVVTSLRAAYQPFGNGVVPRPDDFDVLSLPPRARLVLERAYSDHGERLASALVGKTHAEPPWRDTPKDAEIPVAKIAEFFQNQLKPKDR